MSETVFDSMLRFRVTAGVIAIVLLVILVGAWTMFGTFITAANRGERLEDGLFSMEYIVDYGFDTFLEKGGAVSGRAVAGFLTEYLSHGFYHMEPEAGTGTLGCSTICVPGETGKVLFGRNYDRAECNALILHT